MSDLCSTQYLITKYYRQQTTTELHDSDLGEGHIKYNKVKHISVIVQPSNYLVKMCKNTRVFVCCTVTQMSHVS